MKKELTMDMIEANKYAIEQKYFGGEHINISDFMNAQYMIEIGVGTPQQKFTVIPDTGSSNLWVYGKGCLAIPCLTHPKFDHTKSSTYKKDGQTFDIEYGSGSVKGYVSRDVATVGDIQAPMGFGEIHKVKGLSFMASKMAGILGFGYPSISVDKLDTFIDLDGMKDRSFSFYLKDTSEQSYMVIPGMDSENYEAIEKHPVVEKKYWALQLTSLAQGTKKIDASDYKAVIDSGTSLLVGPKKIVDPLIEGISVPKSCAGVDSLPTLTFTIDNTDYQLESKDYVLKVTQGSQTQCLLGIQSMNFPEGFNYFILGDVFMRRYPSYFSANDDSVSFLRESVEKTLI